MRKRPLAFICLTFLIVKGIVFMIYGGEIQIPAGSIFSQMDEGSSKSHIQVQGRLYKKEYTPNNQVLYLKENSITGDKNSYFESKILIYDDSFQELSIGQTIQVKGTIQKFEGARNPGNFDRRIYYARQDIFGCILRGEIVHVSGEEDVVAEWLFQLRQKWNDVLLENLSETQGPVLSAMLLGRKGDMSDEIKDLYQKNGISHALSISGLHISFIGLGIYGVLRKLGLGYGTAGVLAVCVLSAYSLMIGFSVSVMRAYLMLLLRVGADVSGRVYDMLTALLLSAVIAVSGQPLYFTDASFWLSYGAVIGILLVVPIMKSCLPEKLFEIKGIRGLVDAGVVSLAVQLFLFPMVLIFFYELPVYSVLLNVIVVPLMTWVLGLGMLGSVAYAVWNPLGRALLCMADWLLMLVAWAGEVFAGLPCSRLVFGQPKWWEILIYYCFLFAIVSVFSISNRGKSDGVQMFKKRRVMAITLSLGFVISMCCFVPIPNGKLRITMLDVGQGDCIFMRGPLGDTYLIDGGSSDVNEVGRYRIEPFLKSQGVGMLDYVFVSHGDADHYSGVLELVARQQFGVRIENLVLPGNYMHSEELLGLAAAAEEAGIRVSTMDAGGSIQEGELKLICLQPRKDSEGEDAQSQKGETMLKDNAGSMILQVQFKNFDMLFTGDVEGDGEALLLENPNLPECDVLKVSHHGSKNSTSEEFLAKVTPKLSFISAGKDNSYGHPHQETLERLEKTGCMIYQTAECGAIQLETDGDLIDIFPTSI